LSGIPRAGAAQVLVVEDDEDVCMLVEDILDPHGFQVTCALGDDAAYQVLSRRPADYLAFIIDIDLGEGTTGFDVARYARRLAPQTPVIFMSGVGDGTSVGRFGVPGASFLRKPFTPEELVEAVQQASPPPPERSGRLG
jgi:two-component system, cell cycle response regulator CpdR